MGDRGEFPFQMGKLRARAEVVCLRSSGGSLSPILTHKHPFNTHCVHSSPGPEGSLCCCRSSPYLFHLV